MSSRKKLRRAASQAGPAPSPVSEFLRAADPWLELPLAAVLFVGTWLAAQDVEVAGGWFDVGLCAVAALAGLAACLGRSRRPLSPLLGWPLALWLGWTLLTVATAADRAYALTAAARLLACAACFWTTLLFHRGEREAAALRMALVAAAAATFSSALGIKQWLLTVTFQSAPDWRTFGTFNSPNAFAGFLVLVLPVGATLTLAARERPWRLLGCVSTAIVLGALALTQSKAALLAFALSSFLLVLWIVPGSRARKLAIGLGVVAALVVLVAAVPPARARFLGAFGAQSHSTMFRAYCWQGAAEAIAARPVLGWGPGCYVIAHLAHAQVGYTIHAHNDLLQASVESGLPAALGAIATLAAGVALALRVRPEGASRRSVLLARGIAAGVVALALHGLMDCDWINRPTLGTLMLLLAAAHRLAMPEPSETVPARSPLRRLQAFGWLLLGLAPGLVAALSTESAQLSRQAAEAQRRGLTGLAIGTYERADRVWPVDATALRRRLALEGDPARIREGFPRVLARNPARSTHWLAEADCLLAMGDPAGARPLYEGALRRAPLLAQGHIGVAACAQAEGDTAAARSALERLAALETAPYGRYPAVPERSSLEFVYPAAALAELDPTGPALEAGLERVRGYLARYERMRTDLTKQYQGDRLLVEMQMHNAGLSSARENQGRILLARLLWLRAEEESDSAAKRRLLDEAREVEGPALRQIEAGAWRGCLVETAIYRTEGGL